MISVLLPTYNSSETLSSAIKCLLDQSFKDFELLILDDGSTDDTELKVSMFKDIRLKYHHLTHSGLSNTLNKGLLLAKYDVIARMDSDDLCVPWRFRRQYDVLKELPKNTILSSWYGIFVNRTLQYCVTPPTKTNDIKKGLLLHSFISHPALMCYKNILIENGGYQNNVEIDAFQDYETWLNIKDQVEFTIMPEILVFQRYRHESLSNDLQYKQRLMYQIQEPYYRELKKYFTVLTDCEAIIYRGWREYFYGVPGKARSLWGKMGLSILQYPRIMAAWLITFLPESLFVRFKESRARYRLAYIFKYYSAHNRKLRIIFRSLVNG